MFKLIVFVKTDYSCLPDVLTLAPEIPISLASYILQNTPTIHFG
jgi:hypothetical protein